MVKCDNCNKVISSMEEIDRGLCYKCNIKKGDLLALDINKTRKKIDSILRSKFKEKEVTKINFQIDKLIRLENEWLEDYKYD